MRRLLFIMAQIVMPLSVAAGDAPSGFAQAIALAQSGKSAAAVAAFMPLAVDGHGAAQANLAVLYASGAGVPQNDLEAAYWAWRARLSGESRAADLCDVLGSRLTPDMIEVLAQRLTQTFEAQADSGDNAALLALGVIAAEVQDPPSPLDALIWYTVAAAFEVPYADIFRDTILRAMDPKERQAAQDAARTRFDKHCSVEAVSRRFPSCTIGQM